MTRGLIATEYSFEDDWENMELHPITIHRMNSPYYEGERWCVRHGQGTCLNTDGEWELEPSPSNRDDDFYERCRFKFLSDAFEAAKKKRADNSNYASNGGKQ